MMSKIINPDLQGDLRVVILKKIISFLTKELIKCYQIILRLNYKNKMLQEEIKKKEEGEIKKKEEREIYTV